MSQRLISVFAALFLGACTSITPAAAPERDVVKVMVLGTYHFSNPGLDVVNMKSDDVLTPVRQAELDALVDRLASFRPNVVAVESTRRTDGLLSDRYQAFKPEDLSADRDETVQVGFRLANRLGIDRVYAIDEQEGEIEFFPFERVQALAEQTGQKDKIDTIIAQVQKDAEAFNAAQDSETISQLLARYNDPLKIRAEHDGFYYGLFNLSDDTDHAGAALNYGWYARNALIFSNIAQVARPGDRIVVLYGAGHAYWLRHFVEETPGFELEETMDYLR